MLVDPAYAYAAFSDRRLTSLVLPTSTARTP
jgi:hypothetical protein